ncbi:MAG: hypothetical protein JXQ71_09865 [Verrucomicrobia bacterium]|nr:hypothetical protein [Verrucomicrobiota bacterium]
MTSSQLFAAMLPTLATEILEYAFTSDKPLYKTTLAAVAQARHVRPVFLERQPRVERFAQMIATLGRPQLTPAANTLLSTWLLKKHGPLLAAFLDALKIPHDNGVVETLPKAVDDAALRSAVDQLIMKFPAQIVAVYLHAFNEMNEAHWPNLEALLNDDVRLQIRRDP